MREEAVPINDDSSSLKASQIGVIGVNFKTAPISVRENLARKITLENVTKLKGVEDVELVLLSTCNRIEIYYYHISQKLAKSLENLFQITSKEQFKFYHNKGIPAITHLFEVAAGLDSLVVGETQILLQVKEAVRSSMDTCGPVLSKMFAKAYEGGRKLREDDPEFAKGMKNSVSLAVLELISKMYSKVKKPNLLLVGSGKMVRLATASIDRSKLGSVIVAARRRVLNGLGADSIIPISDIGRTIVEQRIDVVITATSADEYILTHQDLKELAGHLLILDISVPRNVDPQVAKLPGVTLLNLDDLKGSVNEEDLQIISGLQALISLKVKDFAGWFREYDEVAPLLAALRKKAEAIRVEEFENALSRMPNLTPMQKAVIDKMTERLVRRFLHEPTTKLKQMTKGYDSATAKQYTEAFRELFSMDSQEEESSLIAEA
ncbi:MAG: glutamyl-tRNA reductase [Nitrososphaerales archaeon]